MEQDYRTIARNSRARSKNSLQSAELRALDSPLFPQYWMKVRENGIEDRHRTSMYQKPDNALRVAQCNILSHGQTNVGCGFSPLFKLRVNSQKLSSIEITSYFKAVKDAIRDQQFTNARLEKILDEKKIKKIATKHKTSPAKIRIKIHKQWADAKKRYKGKKLEDNYEIMTSEEAKWIHSQAYREVLFSKTWGKKVPNCEGKGHDGFPFPPRLKRVAGLTLTQNPDIITMQEVDRYADLYNIFNKLGYQGWFQTKDVNQGNPSFNGNGGISADGCATFWNANRLRLADESDIVDEEKMGYPVSSEKFNTLHKPSKAEGEEPPKAKQRILFVTLFDTVTKRNILVVNGHFKSGKGVTDREDKRYMAKEFARKLHKYRTKFNLETVIFACDFNAPRSSGAFKLLFEGQCDADEELDPEELDPEEGEHPLKYLSSAYRKEYDESGHHSATKERRAGDQPEKIGLIDKHTIDFIFHSSGFKATGLLSIPHFDTVNRITNGQLLPCPQYPSDHFMIGADLVLV